MAQLYVFFHTSMPFADGAGELREGKGVLLEGSAERRGELQSALSLRCCLLPPGGLQQGALLPEGITQTTAFR